MQKTVEAELYEESPTMINVVVPGILLLVAIGGAIDLALDRPERWLSAHVIVEVALMVTSLTFSIILWQGWRRAQSRLVRTEASLARSITERDAWRKSAELALASFSSAVEQRLVAWGLTPTEREVALLLLKGHGHKQIAARTSRSERTVRQHAVSVYEKSGLSGRAELAAFFLEGLFVPTAKAANGVDDTRSS